MTEQQAMAIVESAKAEFKMIFNSKEDVDFGIIWLCHLLSIIGADYYASKSIAGILLFRNDFPIFDKKACEVLRVLANVLEAKIDIEEKEKK